MKNRVTNLIVLLLTVILILGTVLCIWLLVPKYANTDPLIDKVAELLKLDLTDNSTSYDSKDLVNYPVSFKKKETIALAVSEGEEQHYIEIDGYTLVLNSNDENYKKLSKKIKKEENDITEIVINTIREFKENDVSRTKITNEIIRGLQDYLDSDIVIKVTLTDYKHK